MLALQLGRKHFVLPDRRELRFRRRTTRGGRCGLSEGWGGKCSEGDSHKSKLFHDSLLVGRDRATCQHKLGSKAFRAPTENPKGPKRCLPGQVKGPLAGRCISALISTIR